MKKKSFRKMTTLLLALFLILSATLLSGCWSAKEVDEQVYVLNIGLDITQTNALRVTFQMPSDSQAEQTPSQGEGEKEPYSQSGYILSSAEGSSLPAAIDLLQATVPRDLNISHLRLVVASEELARSSFFMDILHDLMSLRSIRNGAQLVICRKTAGEFLQEEKVFVGNRLSKSQEAMLTSLEDVGFIPEAHLHDIIYAMDTSYLSPLAILASINPFDDIAKDSLSSPMASSGDQLAGEVPRRGINKTEFFGAAVLSNGRVADLLTGYEMQLMHVLLGTKKPAFCTTVLETGESVTVELMQARKPIINLQATEQPQVDIEIFLTAALDNRFYPDHMELEAVQESLQKSIQTDLFNLLQREFALKLDPMGLGGKVAKQFATISEWEAYNWRERLPDARMRLVVNVWMEE